MKMERKVVGISLRLTQTGVCLLAAGNTALPSCQWGVFGSGTSQVASTAAARNADQDITCLTQCLEARKDRHKRPCLVLAGLSFTQATSWADGNTQEGQMQTFQILFCLRLPPRCGVLGKEQGGCRDV